MDEDTRKWKDRYSSLYAALITWAELKKPMDLEARKIFKQWYDEYDDENKKT